MKQIHFKILLILLGMATVFGLSGCEGDGKDGAHSPVNLLDGTTIDEPVNHAPIAIGNEVSTDEETPVDITLQGNDPDGDAITYEINSNSPTHGTVTLAGNIATYTPQDGYSGADSFTFRVKDTSGAYSDWATISIAVNVVNQAPKADAGEDQKVYIDRYYEYELTKVIGAAEGEESNGVTTVDLNGSKSTDDGLKRALTYNWSITQSDTQSKPTVTDSTKVYAQFDLTCEDFDEETDAENCTWNTSSARYECEYIVTLAVNDGEYSDEANVTVTAAYSYECRYSSTEEEE